MENAGAPEDDPELLAFKIERDICSLFHRYAENSGFLDMVEFEDVYRLPYWEYLDFQGIDPARRSFIREGCLMLIVRMAHQLFWSPDSPHRYKLPLCRDAIQKLDPEEDRLRRLAQLALQVLDAAQAGEAVRESISDDLQFLENEICVEYFRRMAGRMAKKFLIVEPMKNEQVSMEKYIRDAERAYDRLYDARSGTEAAAAYNDCKESMAEAIALARAMGMDDRTEELEKKLEHYKAVFRHQFA